MKKLIMGFAALACCMSAAAAQAAQTSGVEGFERQVLDKLHREEVVSLQTSLRRNWSQTMALALSRQVPATPLAGTAFTHVDAAP